jgi:hydrogenase maturation protein HypF
MERHDRFPHGTDEIQLVMRQLDSGNVPTTTSCGRVLDAVSAVLGLCYERSYEGEPAMKLESAAQGGKDSLNIRPRLRGEIIETSHMVREIFTNVGRIPVRDLAFSAQSYIARSLVACAIATATSQGVKTIGFTGGVACNELITQALETAVKQAGFRLLLHQSVPPGDGGLSLGQAVVAAQNPQ